MTAHHLIGLRTACRPNFNQKDTPPRSRRSRKDVAEQFIAAGFVMVDWNKFSFEAYGAVFSVTPSFQGLKVFSGYEPESAIFAFDTAPNIIADWILDWPQRASDWMTEEMNEEN